MTCSTVSEPNPGFSGSNPRRRANLPRMTRMQTAPLHAFTPGERDYIRCELDMLFSTLPTVPEGFQLKTWRGGPDAGKPKLPPTAKGLVERGLTRLDTSQRLPRLFFTETRLAELRTMMTNRRLPGPPGRPGPPTPPTPPGPPGRPGPPTPPTPPTPPARVGGRTALPDTETCERPGRSAGPPVRSVRMKSWRAALPNNSRPNGMRQSETGSH
jgi:hypothetical protein